MSQLIHLLLLATGTLASPEISCRLPAGLYKQYNLARDAQDQEPRRRIAGLYYQYFLSLADAYRNGNHTELTNCLSVAADDRYARLLIALLGYIRDDRRNVKQFVGALPRDAAGFVDFWELDIIALIGHERTERPLPIVGDSQLFAAFVNELVSLTLSGSAAAAEELVLIDKNSDGDYAEHLDYVMAGLFSEHLSVIIRLWPAFGNCARCLPRRDMTDDDKWHSIVKATRQMCSGKTSAACGVLRRRFREARVQ